jgi:hypothetical protein
MGNFMKIIAGLLCAVALVTTEYAGAEEPSSGTTATSVQAIQAPSAEPAAPLPPPAVPAPAIASPYQGTTLTTVTYAMPSMVKMNAGAAAFGMLGGLAQMGVGDKIVRENNIPDAAIAISSKLTPLVAARYQITNILPVADQKDDGGKDLVKLANNGGVVFDVETTMWIVSYFAFDWTHYKLLYDAKARLIDAATGKEVSHSKCSFTTADEPSPPDGDQIVANNATWLKDRLSNAADMCVATFSKELLGQ